MSLKENRKETRKFKAEVKQVLDIVVNSLYTHPEIFIRELVSNSSDALEKMRHEILTCEEYSGKSLPLEIRITTDTLNHTFQITDTGIGMTHVQLIQNLGTIARSGTREYIEKLSIKEDEKDDTELIGKFGVGFYSSFMVGDRVEVKTRSLEPEQQGQVWISDGSGGYTVTQEDGLDRGTTVIVHLKETAREFENGETVKEIIKKYSNFVPYPIFVNGERVNTVQAVWTKSPSEVTDSEYNGFYKFVSGSGEDPLYKLHLKSDAPLQLSSILYVPSENPELFGFIKTRSALNLYCRRILVEQHTEKLLPDYLRFVAGVVDSEDLPLNISRETLQDNTVFRKLGKYLTRRFLKFLEDESQRDKEKYSQFWDLFGLFIKEGILSEFENRDELSRLLRFRSINSQPEQWISLSDYVSNLKEEQNAIYYLSGSSREDIEKGPYIGVFREKGIDVLYLTDPIDDFVMAALGEFDGKRLISADSADLGLPESKEGKVEEVPESFLTWFREVLGERVKEVRSATRVINRPAILVNPDNYLTSSMQKILKASGKTVDLPSARILEVNLEHPVIKSLKHLRDTRADKGFLNSCAEQVFYNALADSGQLEDPREMTERIYDIMEKALEAEEKNSG